MRPISRVLLNNTAGFYEFTGYGERNTKTFSDKIELSFVRVQPSKQMNNGALGEEQANRFDIIFDVRNSKPSGQTFKKGDKITFNSESLEIRNVNPIYANSSNVHHYELEVG